MTIHQSLVSLRSSSVGPWLLLGLVLGVIVGCGNSAISDAKALDSQIEETWMVGRQQIEAISFFESGGQYENLGEPDEVAIDQPHVLPLLKRFRDELSLKPMAILLDPEHAMAIVVEIPPQPGKRNRLREILQEADDRFEGLLMDNWGEKWLSLDFLDGREIQVLERAGSFKPLKAELELQRQKRE